MATGRKKTIDYFPHDTTPGQTMFILESKFGAHGYCAWFRILEILGSTEGHFIDCNVPERWEFLQAKTHCDGHILLEIINTLSNLDAIDKKLWEKKVIWSDNFIERVKDAYKRRQSILPTKTRLTEQYVNKNGKNVSKKKRNVDICPEIEIEIEIEKEREKESSNNDICPTTINPQKLIAKYCENFKAFYGKNPVITAKDSGIAKRLLEIPEIEEILDLFFQSTDEFILKSAHSLSVLESQINRLLVKDVSRAATMQAKHAGIIEWLKKKKEASEQQ